MKEDSDESSSFLSWLSTSNSPSFWMHDCTYICSSFTFFRGRVSMSMMYSSLVSIVSYTILQI